MSRKTEQLQIRLTPEQKASLNRLAQRSGQGISAYVLSRVLPQAQVRFLELLRVLRDDGQKRFALAELNDLLSSLGSSEFLDTVSKAPLGGLSPYLRNYVAAMIEQAATQKRIPPPGWLQEVVPLQAPHFVTSLHSLRLHLLRAAPVPFRRRNIFVDSALGRRIWGAFMTRLTKSDILRLFELLEAELAAQDALGEIYLVGGAVMCLALDARDSTHVVDAFFKPSTLIRDAAARVAARANAPADWLNDAVKGFLSPRGEFDSYLDLPHLRVYVAEPHYLLAMKCAAMRLGEEFHDLDDLRYLLRYLNISTSEEALSIVTRYFDESQLQPKTRLALEELLPKAN